MSTPAPLSPIPQRLPIIEKPEDRCTYPVGSLVVYWHWPNDLPGSIGRGVAEPVFQGIVEVITEESEHSSMQGMPRAEVGETVIRFLDQYFNPSVTYDRFLEAPVAFEEPQRWFLAGINPNDFAAL